VAGLLLDEAPRTIPKLMIQVIDPLCSFGQRSMKQCSRPVGSPLMKVARTGK
jgi:hypothetical protein